MCKRVLWLVVGVAFLTFGGNAEPLRKITFFYTGYVQGSFQPCGCKAGPTGGLARRAGYITDYRSRNPGAILQVDAGNYFRPLGPASEAVNELMLKSLSELPVDVLNLGVEDLFMWPKLAAAELPTRIISTNLRPKDPAAPRPQRFALLTVQGAPIGLERDLHIGFLGVSDPSRVKPNSGFAGEDPFTAVADVIRELQGKADFLVLLGDIPKDTAAALAGAHPEIYLVILAERRFVLHQPEQVGNAVVLAAVERGRYLGRVTLDLDQQGRVIAFKPEYVELKVGVPADPEWHRRESELAARIGDEP